MRFREGPDFRNDPQTVAKAYEDRATVFEAMMLKDEDWWSSRPHLQKKAEFLLEKAEPIFGKIFAGE